MTYQPVPQKSAVTRGESSLAGSLLIILITAIAALALCLSIIPINASMPGAGLDESWPYALNEAVAHHLVFGRDVLFTFGPLASVYTRSYHPETFWIMIVSSAVIALGFCAGALLSLPRRRWPYLALIAVAILPFEIRDAFYTAMALFMLIGCWRLSLPDGTAFAIERRGLAYVALAILSVSIGLIPLVKASMSGLVGAEGLLALVLLLFSRRMALAVMIVALPLASMIAGWILAGQPLDALVPFFIAQSSIISGYTEAMTYPAHVVQVIYCLVASLILLRCLWKTLVVPRMYRATMWLGVFLYLFISFKAGFIRQDGHTTIAATALLLTAIFVASLLRPKGAIAILLVTCFCAYGVLIKGESPRRLGTNALNVSRAIYASRGNLFDQTELRREFVQANEQIVANDPLPKVGGTADVYPTELAALFGNGIAWSGRPVFQSYSAYTPKLDRLNADHLSGPNAPQTVFFEISPIDDRLASLEDASSWPILLSAYRITEVGSRFVTLKRRADARAPAFTELSQGRFDLNEVIPVAQSDRPVMMKVDLRQSLSGKLLSALFRSATMEIEITMEGGKIVRRRFVPAMGETGFVVSPFVDSTADFVMMAEGDATVSKVKSVRLVSTHPWLWTGTFKATFLRAEVEPQKDAPRLNASAK